MRWIRYYLPGKMCRVYGYRGVNGNGEDERIGEWRIVVASSDERITNGQGKTVQPAIRFSPFAIRCSLAAAVLAGMAPTALAQERPAAFVDAATVVPGLIVEGRYAGSHNFVGRPIDGYEAPRCLLTQAAAAALAEVARDLAPRGVRLKAFDCYRPLRAVANFVRWARDLNDTAGKKEFYPDVDKRTLFRDGYISSRSAHSRGSTLDLTLVKADSHELGVRELDMGTPFDFFSRRSWPSATNVSDEAKADRALLANAMGRRGFRSYDKEWWHFTLAHEPFPSTYFDFPVR
jgi:zinc D-Ala-D-Ala dipeptidase